MTFRVQFRCPCGFRNQGDFVLKSLHYEADGDPTGTVTAMCRQCGQATVVRTMTSDVLR